MTSRRLEQVNQLIKREISKIILKEIEFSGSILVTITEVKSSPDLRESRVFVSVLPEDKKDETIALLRRRVYPLQQIINKRLKMKIVPKIIFLEEKVAARAARIEKILADLKKEKK